MVGIGATKDNLHARIDHIGESQQTAVRIVAHEVAVVLDSLHLKALDVGAIIVVGIYHSSCPHLVLFPFLDAEDIALEVVSGIGCGDVEITILQNNEQVFIIAKLAEGCAVLVVVDTIDIGIPPYLAST